MLNDLEKKQTENTPKDAGRKKAEKMFTVAFLLVTVSVILLLFVVRNIDISSQWSESDVMDMNEI